MTEDDLRQYTEEIQKQTDKYIANVDETQQQKNKKLWKCKAIPLK